MIAGVISYHQSGKKGKLNLTLPGKQVIDCSGSFQIKQKRKGTWSLTCTDKRTASGIFEAYGTGKGASGSGTDSQGRHLQFTVGGS